VGILAFDRVIWGLYYNCVIWDYLGLYAGVCDEIGLCWVIWGCIGLYGII